MDLSTLMKSWRYDDEDDSSCVASISLDLQALEIIGNEKVKISKKHLKEIIDLVRKEHIVEEKEKKEELEAKTKQTPSKPNA